MELHSVSLFFRCIDEDSYAVVTRLKDGKAVEENIETNVENVEHFKRLWEENWKPKTGQPTKGRVLEPYQIFLGPLP